MRYPKPEIDREFALELWEKERSEYAKEQVILNNVGMIGIVLKSLHLNPVDEDLFQTGIIGLVKTVNTFTPDRGVKFTAYATPIIRNEILMTLRKKRIIPAFSLDEEYRLGDGDSIPRGNMIPSENRFEDFSESMIDMDKVIKRMGEREKAILNLATIGRTQHEIAKELGISQPQVSRILKKMRNNLG